MSHPGSCRSRWISCQLGLRPSIIWSSSLLSYLLPQGVIRSTLCLVLLVGFSGSADRMALIPVWPNSIGMWEKHKTMRDSARSNFAHNVKYFLFSYFQHLIFEVARSTVIKFRHNVRRWPEFIKLGQKCGLFPIKLAVQNSKNGRKFSDNFATARVVLKLGVVGGSL